MKIIIYYFLIVSYFILFSMTSLYAQNPAQKFNNVIEKQFYSDILNENRRIFIYLPEQAEGKKYPVLYLLDGEMADQYGEALRATQTDSVVGSHIIIGIETVEHRNRDMIPAKISSRPGSGGAGRFLRFLTNELLPYVDSTWHTNGSSILFGASNSGMFTIYAMLENPGAFDGYIASSPMIGHCPDFMNKMIKQFESPTKLAEKYLFIHYGMKDHFKQATEFIPGYYDSLTGRFKDFLNLKLKSVKNGGHVPEGGIEEGLKFIYSKK